MRREEIHRSKGKLAFCYKERKKVVLLDSTVTQE